MEYNQKNLSIIFNNFYYYCQSILKYEQYINNLYNSRDESDHRGYLIDLEEFEKLKEEIKYNIYIKNKKEEYDDSIQIKIVELNSMNQSIEFRKIEPIKIKTNEELLNRLKNQKKYILINTDLYNIICKSEYINDYISYYINQSELFFILNDFMYFHHNQNILSIDSYINKNNNEINQFVQNNNNIKDININNNNSKNSNINTNNLNKKENINNNNNTINNINDLNKNLNKNNYNIENHLLNIIDAMIEFYLINGKIENEIKKNTEYNDIGYLIDIESIEQWKRKINYNEIKNKYFEGFFKDNNTNISNEQKNELLNYIKNLDLKNEIFQFQCLNFKSQKDIEFYTQKKSLILVNQKFYNLICDKREEGKEIKYKMKGKQINIIKDSININLYIKGNIIFSELYMNLQILIKIFYFNEEFKRICSLKQSNNFFLIDKESIKKYKEYFEYHILYNHIINQNKQLENSTYANVNDKICEIINKLPEDYINKLNNKLETNKLNNDWVKILEAKEIMTDSKINNNKKMKYIKDFVIIDTKILLDLAFSNNNMNNKVIHSRFFPFNDKILIVFKDNNLFNYQLGYFKNDEFIVEYLIDLQIKFDPNKGFSFLDGLFKKVNIDNLLNYIYHNNEVSNFKIDDAILFFYKMPNINNNNDISYLNITTNIIINNSIQKKKEDKIKIDKAKNYIQILIEFCKSQNEIINNCSNNEKGFYLVSDRWINEFKSIFYYDKIVTKQIKDLIIKNESNLKNNIYDQLDDNIKNYFINLEISEISNRIINKDLCKLDLGNYDEQLKISYFYKCCLINKDTFDCFEKINIKIFLALKLAHFNCHFINGKIFINFDLQQIIIGHYENDLFITETIIYSNPDNIKIIKDLFKTNGYNFIKYFKFEGEEIEIENSNMTILKILKGIKSDFYTKSLVSPKLTSFLLYYIYQQKIKEKTQAKIDNYNSIESEDNIYLINPIWLYTYEYDEIINKINEINNMETVAKDSSLNDVEKLNNIVLNSDKNRIKELEHNLNQLQYKNDNFFVLPQNLQLDKNKNIKIYTDFTFVNEEIIKLFCENFHVTKNCFSVKLKSGNNKNMIIINNAEQNTILYGSILNEEKIFKLEFIFDYINKNEMNAQMNDIFMDFNKYMEDNLIFNIKDENDIISPIFNSNDSIIGYELKYTNNILNYNLLDYYIPNELINIVHLVDYYNFFNNNINNNTHNNNNEISNNDYYIISSRFLTEIKKANKFFEIKEEINLIKDKAFINNKYNDYKLRSKKEIYSIIKNFSSNFIQDFKNNLKNIQEETENDIIIIEPDLICYNYDDSKENINLYNDFEIIHKKVLELFYNGNIINQTYFSKCIIVDSYIIINISNIFNQDKYISLIGKINEDNIFKTEDILIYFKEHDRNNHINIIRHNLFGFLSNFNHYNEYQYIVDAKEDVIGIYLKYKENNDYKTIIRVNPNNNIYNPDDENNDNIGDNINIDNNNSNERDYNLDAHFDYPYIQINFKFPPLIGLQNIGATCYMNATLQCFCHIERFVNYFKYNHNVINLVKSNKNNLTSSLKLLIEKLWPNNYNDPYFNGKIFEPKDFKNKISLLNPLFEGNDEIEIKDFINFMIMTLHKELNKAKNKNNYNNIIIDQRDPKIMLKNFRKNFIENNLSIMSDLFYGMNCNITQCCRCTTKIYNYQTYFFIVFPLEEIRKYNYINPNKIFNNNNFNGNMVDIYDCFEYDRKINEMSGENSMYCNYCKMTWSCQMQTCLTTGPEILILLLDRGHGIEFDIKINFYEKLNLFNYIEYKNTGYIYQLIGVITHIGESGMGGHFIAYCRDPIKGKWHRYKDSIVNEVWDFQNEVINYGLPYLLLYEKVK